MCKACPVFRMSIRKRYIENRIQQVVDFDDLKSAIDQMFPVKPEPEPEPEPIKVFEIDGDYTQTFLFSISKKDGWDKFLQNTRPITMPTCRRLSAIRKSDISTANQRRSKRGVPGAVR